MNQHISQEAGADSALQPFRCILQHIEKQGVVDYHVGGHKVSRPQSVQQGKEDDRFEVAPDETGPIIWRPQAIQSKNLKATNVASHFAYSALTASPLMLASRYVFSGYFRIHQNTND